jgi:hypothetical protein
MRVVMKPWHAVLFQGLRLAGLLPSYTFLLGGFHYLSCKKVLRDKETTGVKPYSYKTQMACTCRCKRIIEKMLTRKSSGDHQAKRRKEENT